MIPIAYLNGEFLPLEQARVSILDRGFTLGDGLFETMRAYRGIVFQLDRHLDRFYHSAAKLFLNIPLERHTWQDVLEQLLDKNGLEEAIIRVTLTRGEGPPGLGIDSGHRPTLAIVARAVEPLPEEFYRDGVRVQCFPGTAPRAPANGNQIKSTQYLPQILVRHQAQHREAYEGLMVDPEGRLADGTTTNIFLVQDNRLLTPEVNSYVLNGITRQVILELAQKLGMSWEETALYPKDFLKAQEAFLTNTGIEILPVANVDGNIVGDGRPGPITELLIHEFRKLIDGLRGQ